MKLDMQTRSVDLDVSCAATVCQKQFNATHFQPVLLLIELLLVGIKRWLLDSAICKPGFVKLNGAYLNERSETCHCLC